MKKMVTIFFIIFGCFTAPVLGGEKEQLELAFKLVEQTNQSKMFIDLAAASMETYFERYDKPGVDGSIIDNPLRKIFKDEVRLGEDELKWMLAEIYAAHFTENELRQLLVFFDSPAGKAWLDKRLMLQTDSEQIGLEWGQLLTRRVLKKFEVQSGQAF